MLGTISLYGNDDQSYNLDLERLIQTRMLLTASSGGGKTYALRYILEQSHGVVPHIVIDAESQLISLREQFDYLVLGTDGDLPLLPDQAATLCRVLVAARASVILDIADLTRTERRQFVADFMNALVDLPRDFWTPYLIVLDEAHDYAPENDKASPSALAIAALTSKARKRTFGVILATQRLAKLSKDAAADLQNVLVGQMVLDVDVRRACSILGFSSTQGLRLRQLEPGSFFAFGPAIAREIVEIRTGTVRTTHDPQRTPSLTTAPASLADLIAQLRAVMEAPVSDPSAQGDQHDVERLQRDIERLERAIAAEQQRRIAAEQRLATIMERLRDLLVDPPLLVPEAPSANEPTDMQRAVVAPPRAETPTDHESQMDADGMMLSLSQQKILDTLLRLEQCGVVHPKRTVVAVLAHVSANSGGFKNNLGRLRSLNLLQYPSAGTVALTATGRQQARWDDQPLTLDGLHGAWRSMVSTGQRRILDVLIRQQMRPIARDDLAQRINVSATSGGFKNDLGRLRSMEAIDYPAPGMVQATAILFPDQLK